MGWQKDQYKKASQLGDVKIIDDITGEATYSSLVTTDHRGFVMLPQNWDPQYPTEKYKYIPHEEHPKYISSWDYDNLTAAPDSMTVWNPDTGEWE